MRWWSGSGSSNKQQPRDQGQEESKRGKSKAAFSPLAWLSKLTAAKSNNAAASKPKHCAPPAPETKNAGSGFPSFFHKRATPTPSPAASQSSPADSSPAAATTAPEVPLAPRRLSVGNEDAETAAAVRQLCRRRHYSVGGDRDLPPLRHLIPFSRAASPPEPAPTTPMPPLPASDTDEEEEEEKRPRVIIRPRRRCRGGKSERRPSFSGRNPLTPGATRLAVRVRSPRCAVSGSSGLERFAVVRRTSDPQREFRESMVAMIASRRIGRPEELETLLACYLSLNADEHHDCIVKVFRQVWFDLKLKPPRAAAAPARPRG
ncbi:transcription repressor OFP1 [Brachypodium distachyon]|uniref:Transcription repressor n=1 Tax=Brachypodium distachyon TaxID=15368 RepID=I1HRK5_BRADI|nr:transcription repressor OFP1 [Brachypodium distachyon]KQK09737.1 hypothetical protein BRADI_2g49880v3 [Brachypodium distachyon]|eukprot:XP_003567117.1 transcription repressor OFP1 [Brachypodium distachyon]